MIPHNRPTLGAGESRAADRVLRSGWVAQGREVESFENELCSFLRLPAGHAVAVSSGTAALFLALRALGARGKRVALPVYACSALRHATALAGAKELVLDIAPVGPNLDPRTLTRRGAGIAIVPHMFGIPVDLAGVKGVEIIEDCAQALGAKIFGRPTGLQGRLGVFSFYATKLITSGGQGGMLVSKDKALADAVRDFREFDCRKDRKLRFNFQMTDLQAAIGRAQLRRLPEFLKRRAVIFARYRAAGIELLDSAAAGAEPVRYRAVFKTKSPAKVVAALEKAKVKAIVPIQDWELLGRPGKFPRALALSGSTVSLPCYPTLDDGSVDTVIAAVRSAA